MGIRWLESVNEDVFKEVSLDLEGIHDRNRDSSLFYARKSSAQVCLRLTSDRKLRATSA